MDYHISIDDKTTPGDLDNALSKAWGHGQPITLHFNILNKGLPLRKLIMTKNVVERHRPYTRSRLEKSILYVQSPVVHQILNWALRIKLLRPERPVEIRRTVWIFFFYSSQSSSTILKSWIIDRFKPKIFDNADSVNVFVWVLWMCNLRHFSSLRVMNIWLWLW